MTTPVPRRRRPNGTPPDPVRSVRVGDAQWSRAQTRAAYEGLTMSEVVSLLVGGYGAGRVDLPQFQLVYPSTSAGTDDASASGSGTGE